jgi:ribonuclease J
MERDLSKKGDGLLVIPLGGVDQVGANCTLVGYNDSWIMIDLGIAFYDKYGIEILTPDITYPMQIKKKLLGIFITHAHEDHIGAVCYLWPQLQCPVFLTEFPAAILRQKLNEFPWKDDVSVNVVAYNKRFSIGEFKIEFVPIAHSIIDSSSIYVKTPAGSLLHTGDWKIDENPIAGRKVDDEKLRELGQEGVDCLLCDSTNCMDDKDTGSELDVRNALSALVQKHKSKRLTVTCFASNLARIETILTIAKDAGRKVAVIGRSMHKMISALADTTYYSRAFKTAFSCTIDPEDAVDMPFEKVLFLCTGSQGEFRSALYKIARGENKNIKLGGNDVVLFSSKVIPGNEVEIRNLQNLLVRKNVEIVTSDIESDIHVSGHPGKSSVLQMYKWLSPKSLIPVHGDASMLFAQKRFAEENGISNIFVPDIGDVISVQNQKPALIKRLDVEYFAIDGPDIIPINSTPIKERSIMSCNGCVSISILLKENSSLKKDPDVAIVGIPIDGGIEKRLKTMVNQVVRNEIEAHGDDLKVLRDEISRLAKKSIERYCQKKPLVIVHVSVV